MDIIGAMLACAGCPLPDGPSDPVEAPILAVIGLIGFIWLWIREDEEKPR